MKEFDINFDDHWHDEILHELHNKKPLKLTQDHKSSQVKISPTDSKLNLMPGHADWLDQKDKKSQKSVCFYCISSAYNTLSQRYDYRVL